MEINNEFIDLIIISPPYEDISGAGYKSKSKNILFLKFYSDYLNKLFLGYERIHPTQMPEALWEIIF